MAKPFEDLPLKRKEPAKEKTHRYRIYKDDGEYVVIEAETAQEAFKASGLESAKRIEPETIDSESVIDEKYWKTATSEVSSKDPVEPK